MFQGRLTARQKVDMLKADDWAERTSYNLHNKQACQQRLLKDNSGEGIFFWELNVIVIKVTIVNLSRALNLDRLVRISCRERLLSSLTKLVEAASFVK